LEVKKLMIARFHEHPAAPASQIGVECPAHCHQELCGTFVERVCTFLDRYPLSQSDSGGTTPSGWVGATVVREIENDRI
jgi:hypothetical protein